MDLFFEGMEQLYQHLKKAEKEDNIYMGIGILVIGIPFLMLVRGPGFILASAFVIPFAILIPWLRMKFTSPALLKTNGTAFVHLYPEYLDINGRHVQLFGENRWLKNMKVVKGENSLDLLEFDIAWHTRKGDTFDETRIPIPKDKLSKAKELIEFYKYYR